MSAPRPREQRRPPSPPDRRPPRRGGGSSHYAYAASADGRPAGLARLRGVRRGLVGSARALAAAALLALSAALALPAQAQAPCTVTPGDLWCGVMTIGTAAGGPGTTSYGYVPLSDKGSLSPNSFTHEGTQITFELVAHHVYAVNNPSLQIQTSPALPLGYNFVLQAGLQSHTFAGGETVYDFDPPGVDWSMSDGETVTLRLRETPSDNATLSGLAVNDGSSDLALSPAFASDTMSYTAYALMAVDEVTVTPTTLNSNATIVWLDGSDLALADADTADGHQVALSAGANVIKIKVTSQDNSTTKTYTVTVTRAAVGPPAAPTGLSATAGNGYVTLAWNEPASGAVITHHEYRYKTGGAYPDAWKEIPYSAPGGVNEVGFSVTGLDNGTAYTFQLRAANGAEKSGAVESSAETPSGHGRIVESITIRRDDGQDGEPYGIGDKIVFLASFSQNAVCYPSTSRVVFDLGASRKSAGVIGHLAAPQLSYEYTVAEGDVDSDGIEIPAGPTALPDTYFADDGCSNSFDESGINAQGPFPDRKVDGVYPSLDSAVVNGAALDLTWDETLRDDSVPAGGDFTVTVAGASRAVDGVAVNGKKVTLTLASAVTGRRTVTVSYTKGTNPLKDLASNDAPGLTDEAVRNSRTTPVAPPNLSASAGNGYVTLVWDAPASDADITRHEYRFKTGGSYPASWTRIPNSAPGDANASRFMVPGLTNDTAYIFQVRAVNGSIDGAASDAGPVTPVRPPRVRPQTADFYLWSTTMTVGVDEAEAPVAYRNAGYNPTFGIGSISTDADFGFPPWNPPHKHHVDTESYITVTGVWADDLGFLRLAMPKLPNTGNVELWIGHKGYPLSSATYEGSGYFWTDVDLDWKEDDEVRVVLSYERLLPSEPRNVSVTAPRGEDGTLAVSWEEPEHEGTFPIECYLVEFRHPSGDAKKRKQSYPGSRGTGKGCGATPPTSVKRTDLEPGVRYEVLVQALSGDGFSEWSDAKTAPRTDRGRALGARFVLPPERHDGEKRIKVRVAFSEAPENVGADGVEVEGGAVTSVSPVGGDAPGGAGTRSVGGRNAGQEDREVVWEFEIEPDSDRDVTVSLEAGRPCDEEGAICTADGRTLSEGISTTVEGPDEGPPPLTASFEDLPEAHDGESAFRFRLAFSEPIAISFRSLREDAFEVTGGRVTRGKRVDRRKDLFEITVEPDGAGEVAISLPAGRECSVSGAICTWGPPRKQLTNTPTATVAGPAGAPLTASFVDVPAEHDGESAFKLRIAFSEPLSRMSGRRLRSDVVAVSGGRATAAGRVNRRRDLWKVTVEPDSLADVTVTLSSGAACGTPAAVCTSDGRALSNTISTTVRGPVAVSVADARAEEGTDETIDFAVSLSRAASGTVEVSYATADGSATAGEDYTRTGGTLSFAPGETEKTVRVPVLDDAIDEGEETFTLRLTNATGARIADGTATGTIENSDPLQKMWLSRFGRTVAGQVVDAVAGRLSGPAPGSQVTLGGQSIDLSALSADSVDARRTLAGALGAAEEDDPLAGPGPLEAAQAGSWDDPETGGSVRGLTGRQLLLGSSFHLAAGGGEAGGPGYAAWGRIAVGGFDAEAPAEKGEVRLDGEVTTGILGADAQWERWLAGVALSVSEGEGSFDQPGVDSGTVESSLTSVNPYVRYQASDRLSVWGLLGYGTGDMTLTQAANDNRGEIVTRTDISMRLGAAGARGVLLKAGEDGGIDLALRGDAFLVQMDWEKVSNETDTGADASRLRLVLEGGRSFALGEGAVLTPALELGLRHDGGDAETGTGVELGGRISYTDAGSGLTVEANARKLIAHEDSGYEEWGAGGSVRLDPGASGRGLSLTLAPVWGTPSSGVERLWSARDAAGLVRDDDFEAERRLEGEIGYGFGAPRGLGVVTPYAGLSLADGGGRAWRMGARWQVMPDLTLGLEGTRRAAANDDEAPQHGLMLRGTMRW